SFSSPSNLFLPSSLTDGCAFFLSIVAEYPRSHSHNRPRSTESHAQSALLQPHSSAADDGQDCSMAAVAPLHTQDHTGGGSHRLCRLSHGRPTAVVALLHPILLLPAHDALHPADVDRALLPNLRHPAQCFRHDGANRERCRLLPLPLLLPIPLLGRDENAGRLLAPPLNAAAAQCHAAGLDEARRRSNGSLSHQRYSLFVHIPASSQGRIRLI
ncbi:hypothetical protein PFISCL1PPCAC_8806, partial [Pristionchus fissidentatus]